MKKDEILGLGEEEHRRFHRRILYVFIIIMIMLFGSSTFYHYVEKWRYIDALYFSAATVTTVGYGDITPKTDAGKIFTIIFVFMGVGIALYGLSLMASHFVEAREEFWLEKLQGIRIRHSKNILEKLKNLFNYKSEDIVKSYENSKRR